MIDELEIERAMVKRIVDVSFADTMKNNIQEVSEHIYINEWEFSEHEGTNEPEKNKNTRVTRSEKKGEIPGLILSKRQKRNRRNKESRKQEKVEKEDGENETKSSEEGTDRDQYGPNIFFYYRTK